MRWSPNQINAVRICGTPGSRDHSANHAKTLHQGRKITSTFIKDFIEKEKKSQWNFLLASAYGVSGAAAIRMLGPSAATAATYSNPTIAWSYHNRTNSYGIISRRIMKQARRRARP